MSSPTVLTGPRLMTAPFPKSALLPIGAGCANAREFVNTNAAAKMMILGFIGRFLLFEENSDGQSWLQGSPPGALVLACFDP